MGTRVIPSDQWMGYLDNISTLKRKADVRVLLKSDEFGDKVIAERAPLLALMSEQKGSEACAVDIEVGRQDLEHADRLTHSVICTTQLEVEEDEAGNPHEIGIIGEDPETHARVTTVVRFL
jgi:hypothetical protein